jgi:serine/threonine-protein kinase
VIAFVLIALIVGFLLLHNGNDANTPVVDQTTPTHHRTHTASSQPTQPTSSTTTDNTVQVDPADYVGRDFHAVSDELSRLGLQVQLDQLDNDGTHTPDAVTSVNPSGAVPKGSVVTVKYWGPAPATSAPTTPTSAPTTTTSSAALPPLTPPANQNQGGATG